MAKRELSDFESAFAENRRKLGAGKTFEYKGKKYSTNRADDKPSKSEAKGETKTEAPRAPRSDYKYESPAMRSNRAAMDSAAKGKTGKGDTPAAVTRRRDQDAKTTAGLAAATMGPIAASGTALATMGARPLSAALKTRMPTGKEMATEALREPMRKALRRQPGGYAKGGGVEIKGKTKGRFI